MTSSSNPQSEIPNPQLLRLFLYGTLKRGFCNHDRFCRGVLTVEDAVVRGRLFETPSGIPVLRVPEEDILAVGTTNPLADVDTCPRADTHRQAAVPASTAGAWFRRGPTEPIFRLGST